MRVNEYRWLPLMASAAMMTMGGGCDDSGPATDGDASMQQDGGIAEGGGADSGGEPKAEAFALRFVAVANGEEAGCGSTIEGLGPDGNHSIAPSDLRFYVGNLQLLDENGDPVEAELDENPFQYRSEDGQVSLIDLTGTDTGACEDAALTSGTARTNDRIKGSTYLDQVSAVAFDVGVPQGLMQAVINSTSEEDAPSPLGELYWSWASGYRHFLFNFAVDRGEAGEGQGFIHLGSRDCGAMGELALENKGACGLLYTPKVSLEDFDLANDTVTIDLVELLANIDMMEDVKDPDTSEVIGQQAGATCHATPMEPDCAPTFANFGLNAKTGEARAADNGVFGKK